MIYNGSNRQDIANLWANAPATYAMGLRSDNTIYLRQHNDKPFPQQDYITIPVGADVEIYQIYNEKKKIYEGRLRVTLNGCIITE